MKHERLKEYPDDRFRRITRVKRKTFEKMCAILKTAYDLKHRRRGRKPKLALENMPLATFEYPREYRTYAHIAASCGIAESNMFRSIRWVEDVLVKDGTFSPPGRRALLKSDMEYEVVLVDATETPVERPKKNSEGTTPARKSGTR